VAIDWEGEVGAPTVEVFGEAIQYYPGDGAPPFPLVGVFDEGYRETTIIDGLSYTSDAMPVIGINEGQFRSNTYRAAPNDMLQLTDPDSPNFGNKFMVKEVRPDSHGVQKLMLQVYAGALP
jgi:hypothetical protein